MRKTRQILAFAALALALCAISCAKPPTDEMNRAAEAVTLAENNNDAVTYAGNSIARAKDALARMYAESDAKRYDSARAYAGEAIAAAERAITEGRTGAERARDEAFNLVSQLRPLITETEQGISAARSAGVSLDFNEVDVEFDTAVSNADQAQAALSESNYPAVMSKGRTARDGLNSINAQLSSAAMAVTRRK